MQILILRMKYRNIIKHHCNTSEHPLIPRINSFLTASFLAGIPITLFFLRCRSLRPPRRSSKVILFLPTSGEIPFPLFFYIFPAAFSCISFHFIDRKFFHCFFLDFFCFFDCQCSFQNDYHDFTD